MLLGFTLPMGGGEGLTQKLLIWAFSVKDEKRGVPRLHGNMLPGNSFPQICVVSTCIMWIYGKLHKSTYVLWINVTQKSPMGNHRTLACSTYLLLPFLG